MHRRCGRENCCEVNWPWRPAFGLGLMLFSRSRAGRLGVRHRAGEQRKFDLKPTLMPVLHREAPTLTVSTNGGMQVILGEDAGSDPVVCIDASNKVLSADTGEPLFTEEGEPTPSLTSMVELTSNYFEAGKRTEAFVALLEELGLFRQITIEARGADAQTIHGLASIDEGKLYELSDFDFLKLRDQRLLGPIFAHFFSLSQIEKLH